MKKLKIIVDKLTRGERLKGFNLSLEDMHEVIRVYTMMKTNSEPEFINGNVKAVLDSCNIKVKQKGIGWKVV